MVLQVISGHLNSSANGKMIADHRILGVPYFFTQALLDVIWTTPANHHEPPNLSAAEGAVGILELAKELLAPHPICALSCWLTVTATLRAISGHTPCFKSYQTTFSSTCSAPSSAAESRSASKSFTCHRSSPERLLKLQQSYEF